MTQQQLFGWQVIEKQIEINKQQRLNWKQIIGMSLTRACARFKAAGYDAKKTYEILCFEHEDWSDEVRRRLYIGINARFGEMGTSQDELHKAV